jgi:hypothetical protein
MKPYLENTHQEKRAGRVAQGVRPGFKPQYRKKTNKKKQGSLSYSFLPVLLPCTSQSLTVKIMI